MSTELDEAVAYLQFHISFYDRAAETPPRIATASKTVLQALAAAEARLKAVEAELDHLDDLSADLPQLATQTAPAAYWEGGKDAREYLFARIRNVLKKKP